MFAAHAEGRVEDFLSMIHPEVVWQPGTRPARPFYLGRDGTLALFWDMAQVYGDFYLDRLRFADVGGGRVLVRGLIVTRASGAQDPDAVFKTVITVRDNLIVRLEEVDDETASTFLGEAPDA
jgi:hypothetical protein